MGSENLINQKLGKYPIQAVLGEGGMGAVYRSEHPQLGIPVAIKVITNNADQEARQRFLREAQLAARLSHPNVIRIFDVDEQDGMPYLVMELIEGESLLDRLQRQGHIRLEEMLDIGMQLAEGLAYAHSHDMLHRDLKPANVLIRPNGTPVLVDFGLARLTNDSSGLTQSGMIVGTLAYMAPEQLQARPLDARTDVYALGVVFFQMLTGRLPFEGDTAQVMFGHVYTAPPSPSSTGVNLPQSIDSLVVAMMAKEPQGRPQSVAEVANVLRVIRQNPATAPRYVVYTGPANPQAAPAMPPAPPRQMPSGGPTQASGPAFQGPPGPPPPNRTQVAGPAFQGPPPGSQQVQSAPMSQAPARSGRGRLIGMIIAGLVVVGLVGFGLMQLGGGKDTPSATAGVAQSTQKPATPGSDDPTSGTQPTQGSSGGGSIASLSYTPATTGESASGGFRLSGLRLADSFGSVEAYGVLENTGSKPRSLISLVLRLRDASGQELTTDDGYLNATYLAVGDKIGWSITINAIPAAATSYTVEVSSRETSYELDSSEHALAVSDIKLTQNALGITIDGTITNNSVAPTTYNHVVITLLDSSGNVLDVQNAFSGDDAELAPGASTTFTVSSLMIKTAGDVSDTLIFAEGTK